MFALTLREDTKPVKARKNWPSIMLLMIGDFRYNSAIYLVNTYYTAEQFICSSYMVGTYIVDNLFKRCICQYVPLSEAGNPPFQLFRKQ